ncbi:MAG: sulfite exporter TauE/SafE family protein [Chloroflexi bacterium]|nr:MAG: sulfite exporter TauE/SafE family protein [Chloroflexota bacterium]
MSGAELIAVAFVAASAGTLGTMLGLGGGVFLVPILTLAFGIDLKVAVAASAIAIVANSCAGSGVYLIRRFTNLRLALLMLVSSTLGALVGGLLAVSLPEPVLKGTFALVLLSVAYAMARRKPLRQQSVDDTQQPDPLAISGHYYDPALDRFVRYTPRRLRIAIPTSTTAGLASGMFGIGGGPIIVPLMNILMGVPLKAAAGTSAFMVGLTASASAMVYYTRGYVDPRVTMAAVFGIVGGAHLGTRVASRIRPAMLGHIFVIVLVVLAISMVLDAVGVIS